MDDQQRTNLTRECLTLLSDWRASLESLGPILGFPDKTRSREIRRYAEGYAFPDEPGILDRAQHVVYLGEALRTAHPTNPRMAGHWMNAPNKRLDGRTPMERIGDGDENALVAVITLLDCAYAWRLNEG